MADGDAGVATAKPPLATKRARRAAQADRSRRFDILLDVARRISGTESLDQILYALVELTSTEIGCDRSTFFLYDSDTDDLFSRIAQGMRSREIRISAKRASPAPSIARASRSSWPTQARIRASTPSSTCKPGTPPGP